jgi:hypothetical protein
MAGVPRRSHCSAGPKRRSKPPRRFPDHVNNEAVTLMRQDPRRSTRREAAFRFGHGVRPSKGGAARHRFLRAAQGPPSSANHIRWMKEKEAATRLGGLLTCDPVSPSPPRPLKLRLPRGNLIRVSVELLGKLRQCRIVDRLGPFVDGDAILDGILRRSRSARAAAFVPAREITP